jgi:ABC-type phosphate transport system auxiliary subunit
MKLAEALLIRADQKKKLLSLRERIGQNVRAQEGETPAEKVDDLIAQAFALLKEQQALALQIDRANAKGKLADGRPLADALAERETLAQQHALLIAAVDAAQKKADRYSYREIKWVVQIKIAAVQKQADDLSAKLRELNARIQETNWQIDI